MADATYVLDSIVGYDPYDSEATVNASKYIPRNGYAQFLKLEGLKGKRLGIVRKPFFDYLEGFPIQSTAFKKHFLTLREKGANLIDNLEIPNIEAINSQNNEMMVLLAEFKLSLNSYLKQLVESPVRSLIDVIQFNNKNAQKEMIEEYGQDIFLAAEATNGIGPEVKMSLVTLANWSRDGFEKVMVKNKLDAIVTPGSFFPVFLQLEDFQELVFLLDMIKMVCHLVFASEV